MPWGGGGSCMIILIVIINGPLMPIRMCMYNVCVSQYSELITWHCGCVFWLCVACDWLATPLCSVPSAPRLLILVICWCELHVLVHAYSRWVLVAWLTQCCVYFRKAVYSVYVPAWPLLLTCLLLYMYTGYMYNMCLPSVLYIVCPMLYMQCPV